MKLNKIKRLGVLALILLPLSLTGCKKDNSENLEGVEDGEGTAIEENVETVPEPIPEPTKPAIDLGLDDLADEEEVTKDAEIHFIPVGLGESVLLRDHNEYLLVDTGGNRGATLNYLKNIGIKKLKYLVLTQWDNDSLTDVEGILNTYQVDYIIAPELKSTAHSSATNVKKVLDSKGLHVTEPKSRKVDYKIGEGTFSLLNRVANNSTEDDNSLGVYIDIMGTKVFISSDSSTNQEEVRQLGNIDIYSVAKHGASSVNTKERIDALKPKFSVIPTNGNSVIDYTTTEKLLKDVGSKVHRTTDGSIVYRVTEEGISTNR